MTREPRVLPEWARNGRPKGLPTSAQPPRPGKSCPDIIERIQTAASEEAGVTLFKRGETFIVSRWMVKVDPIFETDDEYVLNVFLCGYAAAMNERYF